MAVERFAGFKKCAQWLMFGLLLACGNKAATPAPPQGLGAGTGAVGPACAPGQVIACNTVTCAGGVAPSATCHAGTLGPCACPPGTAAGSPAPAGGSGIGAAGRGAAGTGIPAAAG